MRSRRVFFRESREQIVPIVCENTRSFPLIERRRGALVKWGLASPLFDWLDQGAEANETKLQWLGLGMPIGDLSPPSSSFCIFRLFFF